MKKKVDVFCGRAFSIGPASFAGKCINIVLDTNAIRTCLFNKAFVWELTSDGQRIPLDFSNYDKDNGGVVADSTKTEYDPSHRITKVTKITVKSNNEQVVEPAEKKPVHTTVVKKVVPEEKKEVKEESVSKEEKTSVEVESKVTIPEEKKDNNQHENSNKKFDKYNNKYNKK